MEQRGRAYRRNQRNRAIQRKKRIVKAVYNGYYFKHDGQYSKGHIGCECGLCKPGKRFREPSLADWKKSQAFLMDLQQWGTVQEQNDCYEDQ